MKIKSIILMLAVFLSALAFTACPDEKKDVIGTSGNPNATPLPKNAPTSQMHPDIAEKYRQIALEGGWKQVKETSPGGVVVYSVVEIPDEVLPVIEQAVKIRIEIIRKKFPAWTRGLTLSEHQVQMIEPDGIGEQSKLPLLRLGGGTTAGTIAWGENAFVIIPHFAGVGWQRMNDLRDYVYNEDEHLTEYFNRHLEPVGRYDEFLGWADSHPHDKEYFDYLPRTLKSKPVADNCEFSSDEAEEIVVTTKVRE